MSTSVSEQVILDALHQIPEGRWADVLHFLESIKDAESPIRTADEMAQSPLIGLWSDRTDLGATADFAARLRSQSESRRRDGDAAGH